MKFTYTFDLSDEQVSKLNQIRKGMINHSVKSNAFSEAEAKKIYSLEEVFEKVMLVGEKWRVDEALSQMLGLYANFINKETEI